MSEPSDYEDCGCAKCCLPTIVQERDEALAERDRHREAAKRLDAAWLAWVETPDGMVDQDVIDAVAAVIMAGEETNNGV